MHADEAITIYSRIYASVMPDWKKFIDELKRRADPENQS